MQINSIPTVLLLVIILSAPVQASSILVTWNPPSTAPPGTLDYYVYVSTTPGFFEESVPILVENGEQAVIDVPSEGGTAYYFAVQSVDAEGNTSSLATPSRPMLAAGPGPGWANSDTTRLFSFEDRASEVLNFTAFGNTSQIRGVQLACGDVLGLGEDQIVAAPGPGNHGAEIRLFHADGTPVVNGSFQAFLYNSVGASICCGDLDGDGRDEIVAGVGPGRTHEPGVKVFSYIEESFNSSTPLAFLAYPQEQGYGVKVACGDLDGDGRDEIITGCGPGPTLCSRVRVFRLEGDSIKPVPGLDFVAYGNAETRGVNVASGDVDGDGYDEIVTGPGPALNCNSDVRVFNVDGSAVVNAGQSFRAYPLPHFGVKVAVADVNNDCFEEVITAPGPSPNYPGAIRWFSLAGIRAECLGQIDAFAGTADDGFGANLAVGRLNP